MMPKFRAWLPCKQQMAEVTMLDMVNKEVFYTYKDKERNARYGFDEYKDMVTVMQSTGLFDKNNVEIFEEDYLSLVDFDNRQEHEGKVVFADGCFCLEVKIKNKVYKVPLCMVNETDALLEVIGNVYEDPELIKEDETWTQ